MTINNPIVAPPNTSGTYAGNNTANRAIPHGLGEVPKLVVIIQDAATSCWNILESAEIHKYGTGPIVLAVTAPDATNFYVGNVASYENSANDGFPRNYHWVALK